MEAGPLDHDEAADEEGAEDENDLNDRIGEDQKGPARGGETDGNAAREGDPAEDTGAPEISITTPINFPTSPRRVDGYSDGMSIIAAIDGNFIFLVLVVVVLGIVGLVFATFFKTWLRAKLSDSPVSWSNLIGMFLRKVPFSRIVDARITAVKAGLPLGSEELEAHYLSGGDVEDVVLALIAADKAGINLPFDRACAIDLAVKGTTKTVLEAVRTSINPKVIECPNPEAGITKITAVAKDGIAVNVRARVTVRTNLDSFIGGATEETVIARVGEGIVTSVGSAESYKAVLENPDSISKLVLSKGVDSSTAFEILSIDIADVDVADNVGARLQTEQAEADKRVAQARAEMRRAAAVAVEQEMSARTQEMRAKVVEAEAEVPQAIAEAFRSGNLGVMDYTRYKNIIADTDMRSSIASDEDANPDQGESL